MSSLTDRYVWAVVRGVPEQQRTDIERELRASIGDDIEARIEGGQDAAAAEHAALTELGDPDRLAASYAQRPNFLVGPRYYFDYVRLLKLLYAIVLPTAALAIALGQGIAGAGIGEIIGSTVVATLTVGVHLGFWVTLVFAVLERGAAGTTPLMEWTPDQLPQVPDRKAGAGLGELVASAVFLLVFAGAIVWQQFFSVFRDAAGEPIPVLQPELWSLWIPYTFALVALELAFAVALYAKRRWTWGLAIANVVLNIAFVVPAVWLVLGGRVVNPAFIEHLGWTQAVPADVLNPILIVVFVGAAGWDIVDGFLKARGANLGGGLASGGRLG